MDAKAKQKDSMKSTWRVSNREDWNIHHWLIELLGAHAVALDVQVPVFTKDDKIPYLSQFHQHAWVLFYACMPLAAHQAWLSLTGSQSLSPIAVFGLYFFTFNAVVVVQVHMIRRMGQKFGFLDGDKYDRDGVPDVGVDRVASSLYKTTGSRLAAAIYLSYTAGESPLAAMSSPAWWAQMMLANGLYGIVLDFWFYWYHRAMHDVDLLWKYHRTHHLTKHPNPLLTAYADHEQEFFDMVGVPLMTWFTLKYMGLPLDFYQWWLCHQYIIYTEVMGHSGLRIHVTAPSTLSWLLKAVGAELVIEDHDLHHRKGWRKTNNYGKQTRLWDSVFGTCHERIESREENVDYHNKEIGRVMLGLK